MTLRIFLKLLEALPEPPLNSSGTSVNHPRTSPAEPPETLPPCTLGPTSTSPGATLAPHQRPPETPPAPHQEPPATTPGATKTGSDILESNFCPISSNHIGANSCALTIFEPQIDFPPHLVEPHWYEQFGFKTTPSPSQLSASFCGTTLVRTSELARLHVSQIHSLRKFAEPGATNGAFRVHVS